MGAAIPNNELPAEGPRTIPLVEGWFAADRDLRIVEWGKETELLLGLPRAEAIGRGGP